MGNESGSSEISDKESELKLELSVRNNMDIDGLN